MKDNISKRRFYLNKKEKNNSYNKEKNLIDKSNTEQIYETNKQKTVKNFILSPNKNESENTLTKKNKNYFRFFYLNQNSFSPNNIINENKKINYTNSPKNQDKLKFIWNNNNKSFETNKAKANKNNDKKDNNKVSSFKLEVQSNNKKEKEKSVKLSKKISFLPSFYSLRNKKKEIIKLQSTWRGYYFRKIKNKIIQKYIVLVSLFKVLEKFLKRKRKFIFKEFVNILKIIQNKRYKYGNTQKINFKEKYNDNYNRRYYGWNNSNIKTYSKLKGNKTEINEEKKLLLNKKDDRKDKNENNNELEDIFNVSLKIIYIPKKLHNKNRYYYMKRLTKIKKLKLEKFIKFIKKKFFSLYFTSFINNSKFNSDYYKTKKIFVLIDSIIKNKMKKYLKIYREKILDIKVKEEIMKKKTLPIFNENTTNNIKLFRNKRNLNENKIEKKSSIKLKRNIDKNIKVKFKDDNIANDIIIENINESENEEENTNNNYKNKKVKDYFLLNKIILKKIKYRLIILNKYFMQWKKYTNLFNKKKIKIRNMHSPDMELRGNKNKKRHIKIKYSKALTSKTSFSSIKSEGRSNSSRHFYIKKMKVRNVVINSFDHSIINYRTENNYMKQIKLSYVMQKIDNKSDIIKCFKIWKKNKKNRRNFSIS